MHKTYYVNGENLTLQQIEEKYKVKSKTLLSRMQRKGCSIEEAVRTPNEQIKIVQLVKGDELIVGTYTEIAQKFGMNYAGVAVAIKASYNNERKWHGYSIAYLHNYPSVAEQEKAIQEEMHKDEKNESIESVESYANRASSQGLTYGQLQARETLKAMEGQRKPIPEDYRSAWCRRS